MTMISLFDAATVVLEIFVGINLYRLCNFWHFS